MPSKKTKEQELEEINKKIAALNKLKKEKESLTKKEEENLNKLKQEHMKLTLLSQRPEQKPKMFGLQTDNAIEAESILKMYKKRYSDQSWYKEPSLEDGKVSLDFPNENEAINFFHELAQSNQKFIVVEESNNVLAYSNGDGELRHGDGNKFTSEDSTYKEDTIPLNEFLDDHKHEFGQIGKAPAPGD